MPVYDYHTSSTEEALPPKPPFLSSLRNGRKVVEPRLATLPRLPLIFAITALLITTLIENTSALKCYQGQQNATLPAAGSATECPMAAMSCIKSVDPSLQIATRACQTTSCMLNNVVSPTGVCQNSTSYPYQTYCCCYGDGCNGVAGMFGSVSQLVLAIAGGVSIAMFTKLV